MLNLFHLPTDYDLDLDLDIMKPGQSLSELAGRILADVEYAIPDFRLNIILAHGDASTILAASLESYYQQIPVGQVEGGLRVGNLVSPRLEEVRRRLAGKLAALHFAPTESSRQSFVNENVPSHPIKATGNTVLDALQSAEQWFDNDDELRMEQADRFRFPDDKKKLIGRTNTI